MIAAFSHGTATTKSVDALEEEVSLRAEFVTVKEDTVEFFDALSALIDRFAI